MRVLQLISSNGFYGAEGVMALLTSGLTALGCTVKICLFDKRKMPPSDLNRLATTSGAPISDLRCGGGFDPRALSRLIRLIRDTDADLIHCHGYKADVYGLLAARFVGCKIIATCHNWSNRTPALCRSTSIDLRFLQHFDAVVAVSDNVASVLHDAGLGFSKVRRINNGVDVTSYRQTAAALPPTNHHVIGVISRLSQEKGIDVLIRAMPRILEAYPTASCIVVGEGPEREPLIALAEQLNVAKHFQLDGFCSDTVNFFKRCTVVVLPSRTEGMPLALLEAMASGCPIVATSVGSVPELLLGGKAGVLVPPDDHKSLAEGILRMLSDRDLRERTTERSAEHVRDLFDASVMTRNYFNTYQELYSLPADAPAARS